MIRILKIGGIAVVTFLGAFTGVALAADALGSPAPVVVQLAQAAPADPNWLELARPVYEAFARHQYGLMIALLVILLVAITKRWLAPKIPFLHSDAGGSAMALLVSMATAIVAGLMTPGAPVWPGVDLLKTALVIGVGAAGGYAMLKNLVVDPFLRPLAAKAPAWMQPIFAILFFAFDKKANPIADAVKAGDDAVIAAPAPGIEGVVGTPVEVK